MSTRAKLPMRKDAVADSTDIRTIMQSILSRIERLERIVGDLQRRAGTG